jgi:hypothetical protein
MTRLLSHFRLSGNALKIIAAVAMVIDHAGLMFFPDLPILRIIGRLAFPIFAFMIAEGCRYTRNRLRYFGMVFGLGAICQIVYFVAMRDTYMSVLITFSLSILVIYAWQNVKEKLDFFAWMLLGAAVIGVWLLNQWLTIDYGFHGCMTPVCAALAMPRRGVAPIQGEEKFNNLPTHVALMGISLLQLALESGGTQWWSLLALPLLLLYSGQRGKWNMKYFFYIFYPTHLVLLEAIAMLA